MIMYFINTAVKSTSKDVAKNMMQHFYVKYQMTYSNKL